LFWAGTALQLIPVHMLLGMLLVVLLWLVAVLAFVAGANRGLAVLAIVWGVVMPALGVTQDAILPGDLHWLVRLLHLAVGIVALGLVERLAHGIKVARTRTVTPQVVVPA
jgi:hypothetical protein